MFDTKASKIDRQIEVIILPMVVIVAFCIVAFFSTVERSQQLTICEINPSNNGYSLMLLDGNTEEVSQQVGDSLAPLTTYNVKVKWFSTPVFIDVAEDQDGIRCWNAR